MRHFKTLALTLLMALSFIGAFGSGVSAQQQQARYAFVIGNDDYEGAPLASAANDAGLIAETLKAAGFDVAGARNLDAATMRAAFQEFLQKVQAAGPGTVAAVYISGYGVQMEGDNYLIPPGASVLRDTDIPLNAVRIFDMTRALGALQGNTTIITLDLAYQGPFAREGQPIAPGLSMMDPDQGMLIAINTQPGAMAAMRSRMASTFGRP